MVDKYLDSLQTTEHLNKCLAHWPTDWLIFIQYPF